MDEKRILNRAGITGISYTISYIYNQETNFLIFLKNEEQVERFLKDLDSLSLIPKDNIFYFPHVVDDDSYTQEKTKSILLLNKNKKGVIFVTDQYAIEEKVISIQNLDKSCILFKKNEVLKRDVLLEFFEKYGYRRVDRVVERGEFSIRGGIVDFFPYIEDHPIRLEFWGDIIESLRVFSEETQLTIDKLIEKPVYFANYRSSPDISFATLLNKKFDILVMEEGDDFPPFLPKKELIYFSSFNKIGDGRLLFSIDHPPSFYGNISLFLEELQRLLKKGYIIKIFLSTNGLMERFKEILNDTYIPFSVSKEDAIKGEKKGLVTLVRGDLENGLLLSDKEIVVFTEREILGRKKKFVAFSSKKKIRKINISEFSKGDYVVHKEYGIGIYRGLNIIHTEEGEKEYVTIEYKDGDILYLSPQKLFLLKKYVGTAPTLNKLKGGEWKRVKEKVKKETREIAKRLYELYTERSKEKGFSFPSDTLWQKELELSFPFNETEDQLKAIQDVKRDMERDVPMERVICGDVGYGKTEIAIRAAFKAVEGGKQVAFLVPTTILASQHYETFKERLSAFPVTIEVLSRFRTKKEQKEIIERLYKGEIDIIIGTHRLLQNDVKFRDLGLLIIDEEQRFGVMHKERLKELKKNIDVLILTATPIPRTLYMALTGVKDLSLITTPPENRLSIETFVYKKSNKIIREAILNEIKRGGQIFYVHNRIKDLPGIKANIEALISGIKVAIAHGQMDGDELEDILIDFWEGKFDILVTTTIIEIGIDFPNVNTIIIDDSYRYGLSQLYQLRGRVGRSHKRAYAYLLYPSYEKLSGNSKKRLEAIFEYQELGSGFNLALRDLEIRGAGALLGKSQHGYNEVGMELYSEFIREGIEDIREEKGEKVKSHFDFEFDYYIPYTYISSPEERMYYYKRFMNVNTEEELKNLKIELIDRFGRYGKDVKRIFDILTLKIKAKKVGFERIIKKDNYLEFAKNGKEYKIDIKGRTFSETLALINTIVEKELENE